MHLTEKRLIEELMKINNFSELNPMQKKALKKNIFEGNLIISAPTASGKTFIAELLMIDALIKSNRKIVYTAPLKALANEHYRRFKKLYSRKFNIKVTISTGDFDSPSNYLAKFDVIYTTYEKLDSLIRHNAHWLSQIGMLVVDEIHELDSDRGATIELLATKLKFLIPDIRIIGLSATIPNAEEIAKWLNAKLIVSSYRAVPLKEGVYFNGKIYYESKEEKIEKKENPIESLIFDTLNRKKQILIFANSRRSAENIAQKISQLVEKFLSKEKKFLEKHSAYLLNVLEQPTEQCKKLAELTKHGVAFHHAGLLAKQRSIIEDLFRNSKLKVIVSTPTLALGVNLPSHTVVIHSLYRYSYGVSKPINVREYKQMIGRAGRPKYDKEGRAIIIARNENEIDYYFQRFVLAPLEDIHSQLSLEPVLRMHLLSLIANNFVYDYNSMERFFSKTFFASQYGDISALFSKLDDIIKMLEEFNFVRLSKNRFEATPLGNRVSQLYIDPISANKIINCLMQEPKKEEMAYLMMICDCYELYPYANINSKQANLLYAEMMDLRKDLFLDIESCMFDEDILQKFALAKIFYEWINEVSEQEIMENYKMQPGILRSRLEKADWLLYSAIELEKVLRHKLHRKMLNILKMRMKYGVKEELLALVQLKYIGRVRARRLYRNGFRRIADLKKAPTEALAKIIGKKIAESIKNQLFPQRKFKKF